MDTVRFNSFSFVPVCADQIVPDEPVRSAARVALSKMSRVEKARLYAATRGQPGFESPLTLEEMVDRLGLADPVEIQFRDPVRPVEVRARKPVSLRPFIREASLAILASQRSRWRSLPDRDKERVFKLCQQRMRAAAQIKRTVMAEVRGGVVLRAALTRCVDPLDRIRRFWAPKRRARVVMRAVHEQLLARSARVQSATADDFELVPLDVRMMEKRARAAQRELEIRERAILDLQSTNIRRWLHGATTLYPVAVPLPNGWQRSMRPPELAATVRMWVYAQYGVLLNRNALQSACTNAGSVADLVGAVGEALTPPPVKRAVDALDRGAAAAEKAAISMEATCKNADACLDEMKSLASVAKTALETLQTALAPVCDIVAGVDVLGLVFGLVNLCRGLWSASSVPELMYVSLDAAHRFLSSCGYHAGDVVSLAARWCARASNNDSSEAQVQSGSVVTAASAVSSLLLTAIVGSAVDARHYRIVNEVLRMHGLVTRSIESLGDLPSFVGSMVPVAIESALCALLPSKWAAWFFSPSVYGSWMRRMQNIIDRHEDPSFTSDPAFCKEVLDAYDEFSRLLTEREEILRWRPAELALLREHYRKLALMRNSVYAQIMDRGRRAAPTCIWIAGEAGCGKSVFADALIMAVMDWDDIEGKVFSYNVQAEHMNGYKGHKVIKMEELMANKSNDGMKDFTGIFNTATHRPEFATLEEGSYTGWVKGRFIAPELGVCLSNALHPLPVDCNFVEAIWRRRDVVLDCRRKAEYRGLPFSAIPEQVRNVYGQMDIWLCAASDPSVRHGPITAYEAARFCRYVHITKQEAQRALLEGTMSTEFAKSVVQHELGHDEPSFFELRERLSKPPAPCVHSAPDRREVVESAHMTLDELHATLSSAKSAAVQSGPPGGHPLPVLDPSTWVHPAPPPPLPEPPEGSAKVQAGNEVTFDDLKARFAREKDEARRAERENAEKALDDKASRSWSSLGRGLVKVLLAGTVVAAAVVLAVRLWFPPSATVNAYAGRDEGGNRAIRSQSARARQARVTSTPSREMAAAPDGLRGELAKLFANAVRFNVGGEVCGGIMTHKRIAIVPRHIFLGPDGKLKREVDAKVFLADATSVNCAITPSMWNKEWETPEGLPLDVVAIDLSTVLPRDFPDIRDRFWSEAEMDRKLPRECAYLTYDARLGWWPERCEAPLLQREAQNFHKEFADKGKVRWVASHVVPRNALRFRGFAVAGDSGSPVFSYDATTRYRLVGLHSGMMKDATYAQHVTREMLSALDDGVAQVQSGPDCVVADTIAPIAGLIPVGRLRSGLAYSAPMKSQLRHTVLHDALPPVEKAPARLRPFVRDGERVDPMQLAVAKLGARPCQPELDVWVRAREHVIDTLCAQLSGETLEVLDAHAAIFGTDRDFEDRMNPDSSPGFPYKWEHPGMVGKRHLIDFDNKKVLDERVSARAEARWQAYARNEHVGVLSAATLKDEMRSLDRVAAGKTRLFQIVPLDLNIVIRRLCLSFCAALMRTRTGASEMQVGINATSTEWADMARDLTAMSSRWCGGDYPNFDGIEDQFQGSENMEVFIGVMRRLCPGWCDEYERVARSLQHDVTFSYIIVRDGLVYQKTAQLPSGVSVTVVWNCIQNMRIHRAVFITAVEWPDRRRAPHVTDEQCAELNEMHERLREVVSRFSCPLAAFVALTRLKCYGDDFVLAVSLILEGRYGFRAFRRFLWATMKWDVTPPTKKEDDTYDLVAPNEVDFLKRGFRDDPYLSPGGPVAPLAWDSVVCRLSWQRENADPEGTLRDNVVGSLREACLHGPERYDALREVVRRALVMAGIAQPLPTYEELALQYRRSCFPDGRVGSSFVEPSDGAYGSFAVVQSGRSVGQQAIGAARKAVDIGKKVYDIVQNPLNLLDVLFDKPNIPLESAAVVKTLPPMAEIGGATHASALSVRRDYMYVDDPANVGTATDELSFKEFATRPCIVDLVSVNMSSTPAGSLLYTGYTGPMGNFVGATPPSKQYSCFAVAGLCANFFRGSTKVIIDVFASPTTSGKLLVAYKPGRVWNPDFQGANEGYFWVLDVGSEHQQFVLDLPYVRDRPWARCVPCTVASPAYVTGTFAVFNVGTFNAPANVASTWQFAVSVAAGQDAEWIDGGATLGCVSMASSWKNSSPPALVQSGRADDVENFARQVDRVARDCAVLVEDIEALEARVLLRDASAAVQSGVAPGVVTEGVDSVPGFGTGLTAQPAVQVEGMTERDVTGTVTEDADAAMDLGDTSRKFVLLQAVQVATGVASGTLLAQWSLPAALVAANRTFAVGFLTAQFWRGDLEVVAMTTGNQFLAGAVLLVALPVPLTGTFAASYSLTYLSSLPHVIIRPAGGQSATLSLPWKAVFSAYNTETQTPALYQLGLFSLSPITAAAGTFGGCTVNVFARAVTSHFSVPQPRFAVTQSAVATPIGSLAVAHEEGATIGARDSATARKGHGAEVTSITELMKRYEFAGSFPLGVQDRTSLSTYNTVFAGWSSVVDLAMGPTTTLQQLSQMFALWSGELNLRLRVQVSALVDAKTNEPGPLVQTFTRSQMQYIGAVGYCPHGGNPSGLDEALLEWASGMLTAKSTSIYANARSSSGFVPLAAFDETHPWVDVVVPYMTDLNCTFVHRNADDYPWSNTGYIGVAIRLGGYFGTQEPAITYVVKTVCHPQVAAGDSFRFHAFQGVPWVRFVTMTAGPRDGDSVYPAEVQA